MTAPAANGQTPRRGMGEPHSPVDPDRYSKLSLADLQSDRRIITVKFLGREVHVEYRPSAWTPEFFEKTDRLFKDGDFSGQIVAMIVQSLTWWSLVDEHDVMMPITPENVTQLPNKLLWDIWNGAQADVVPKEPSASKSNASS